MAKYRNKKTKAVLETECEISGGDWVKVTPRKGKEDDVKIETVDTGAENGGTGEETSNGGGDGDNGNGDENSGNN